MSNPNITDPLYDTQWHFDLLGDIETIWADYTGEGVTVAVYDDGMDTDHEDLVDNYDASLQMAGDDGLNNSSSDGHGTSVGGLIAGSNNGIGGVGVAFNASLTSVDFLNDAFLDGYTYEAIAHMGEFDIINQSYGYNTDFNPGLSLGDPFSQGRREAEEMWDAVIAGRGGLGTVMVKAVGNSANNAGAQQVGNYGNAQGDGSNNSHFLIGVGALNPDGTVASYSSYGANLLVSAGAGSVTTDLTGSAGYSSDNYTNTFGGTSAATPVTAGVIALMLEANPDLNLSDIQMILALSASMTGSALGDTAEGFEAGEWVTIGDGTWNGGGMTYNLSYGFGAVDAYAAVRMAEIWSALPINYANPVDQEFVEVVDSANYAILDNAATDITLNVEDGILIQHVYVTIDLYHTYAADLDIHLITPWGDEIELRTDDGGGAIIDGVWTYGIASLRGQDSEGEWIVRVANDAGADQGTVYDVNVTFVGDTVDENASDVWHFTDDFLDLVSVEAGRNRIGGEERVDSDDTINMVAVTGDVTIDMGVNGAVRVDTEFWALQNTDSIMNAVTGDGDDRINGRDADEGLAAGRGNDLMFGGGGNDLLSGQQGNDVIFGDSNGGYGTFVSAQVFRIYNAVFGRTPDTEGHQVWMNRLLTGEIEIDDVANAFIGSREFEVTYGSTSTIEFVTLLYENVLGREPDQTGLDGWVNNINTGMSRAEVVRRFSESQEHVNLTAADLVTYENDSDATVYAGRLYRLYEGIFGREPDVGGFLGWMDNFANGMTFVEVAGRFMAGPEFQNLYSDTTNEDFVELLYLNVLQRAPDEGGLAGWLNNLDNGMPRETVVERFIESREFVNRTTDALIEFINAFGQDDYILAGSGTNLVAGGGFADVFLFTEDDQDGSTTILDFELWDSILIDTALATDVASALSQRGDDVVFATDGFEFILADTDLNDIRDGQIQIADIDI
ncbi:DUF4214 domain-containing protein [Pseudooctadecabacter sp.]|uniref:DUF4214 domain-containing protein n=1 Tax=Pseudooctadecabacter sp. TaxID=1966338 RepID=UPI003F6B6293